MNTPTTERLRPALERRTDNLTMRLYRRCPDRVVIVFASAGAVRQDGFAEEYAGSLAACGVSVLYITDIRVRWYNYDEALDFFRAAAGAVAGFEHVMALGESLGGSGALLMSRFVRCARTLAITPQYSVAKPFVNFDERYTAHAAKIERLVFPVFSAWSDPLRTVILFGNRSWRDGLHAAMFTAEGLPVGVIDDAPHELSAFLKQAGGGAGLRALIGALCDVERPFTLPVLQAAVPVAWGTAVVKEPFTFATVKGREVAFAEDLRHPVPRPVLPGRLVSRDKPATQSSVSPSSKVQTREGDAAGAVSGTIGRGHAFHTRTEPNPWWQVDLGAAHRVSAVALFNRLDHIAIAERARNLDLRVSDDGEAWTTVCTRRDETPFGGADGRPFVWQPAEPIAARFVRVQLAGNGPLHLAQVEVYARDP